MAEANQIPTSEVHLRRYYRSKREDIAAIAASEHVEEKTVKDSIAAVELYRTRRDIEAVNEATRDTVLEVMPEVKHSLRRQLRAKNGKKQDYAVQRAAVAEVRGLLQTVQPKIPVVHATQVNVDGQRGGTARIATGSYLGMEDRLKMIQQELDTQKPEERRQLLQGVIEPIIEGGEGEEAEPAEIEA